jgi:hypothetical protein
MNRNVAIATAVGIVIIIGAISYQIYDYSYERSTADEYYENLGQVKTVVYPENPQRLGGLVINKDKYIMGENVFINVVDIPMGLKSALEVYTPSGMKYMSLPIDGDEKNSLKHYFRPSLTRSLDLCDKEEIAGKWTMKFAGFSDKLQFEVMNEILPNSEEYYEDCGSALKYPTVAPSLNP